MDNDILTPIFLNVKEAAASLEEVAVDVIKTENQNVLSYWYHSPMDIDIYLWFDEKQNIIKQQVNICGQIVEWNIVEGVKTGFLVEVEKEGEHGHPVTRSKKQSMGYSKPKVGDDSAEAKVMFDAKKQGASVKQTVNLVKNADVLNDKHRSTIIANFETSPKIDNLDPIEFLSQFGHKEKNRNNSPLGQLVLKIQKFLKKAS